MMLVPKTYGTMGTELSLFDPALVATNDPVIEQENGYRFDAEFLRDFTAHGIPTMQFVADYEYMAARKAALDQAQSGTSLAEIDLAEAGISIGPPDCMGRLRPRLTVIKGDKE